MAVGEVATWWMSTRHVGRARKTNFEVLSLEVRVDGSVELCCMSRSVRDGPSCGTCLLRVETGSTRWEREGHMIGLGMIPRLVSGSLRCVCLPGGLIAI